MSRQPFHHGNLRAVLLAEAERTLRERGVEELSLRQLAREAGVSHGAPRHHFADRQALLNALAELGFQRLTEEMETAIRNASDDYVERFQAAAAAYVRFAVDDAALLELMFTTKNTEPPEALTAAAEHFFTTVNDLIAQGMRAGQLQLSTPDGLQLLLVATLQGIATLMASGRLHPEQADALITDATTLFTRAPSLSP